MASDRFRLRKRRHFFFAPFAFKAFLQIPPVSYFFCCRWCFIIQGGLTVCLCGVFCGFCCGSVVFFFRFLSLLCFPPSPHFSSLFFWLVRPASSERSPLSSSFLDVEGWLHSSSFFVVPRQRFVRGCFSRSGLRADALAFSPVSPVLLSPRPCFAFALLRTRRFVSSCCCFLALGSTKSSKGSRFAFRSV